MRLAVTYVCLEHTYHGDEFVEQFYIKWIFWCVSIHVRVCASVCVSDLRVCVCMSDLRECVCMSDLSVWPQASGFRLQGWAYFTYVWTHEMNAWSKFISSRYFEETWNIAYMPKYQMCGYMYVCAWVIPVYEYIRHTNMCKLVTS
jgi:hypothetical protein